GRLLRPEFGNFNVALLEYDLASLVPDDGRSKLPLEFIKRIDPRFAKEARKRQPRRRGELGFRPRLVLFHACIEIRGCIGSPSALDRLLAGTRGLVGSAFLHISSTSPAGFMPEYRSHPPRSRPRVRLENCVRADLAGSNIAVIRREKLESLAGPLSSRRNN